MQHMESNMCQGVTKDQFLRARMINAIVHGAFDNEDEDRAKDGSSQPTKLDLKDKEQFPSLDDSGTGCGYAKSTLKSKTDTVKMETGEEGGFAGRRADSVGRPVENPENRPKSPGKRRELNQEHLRKLQGLSRKMLGADTGIRRKVREDGAQHSMEVLHPLSPFFNAELFRNTQGHFECPFSGCE